MSALDSFVVWTWHAVWNLRLLLLLLPLIVLIVPVLRLIVVVLTHSVHIVLHAVSIVTAAIAAHVLATSSTEALEIALSLHSPSAAELSLWTATSSSWRSPLFPHLLVFTRRLIAVLVLDALLCQYELLRGERVAGLTELLITMSKVALFLKKAVFMSLIMPASLSLVLLVQLFHFLLTRSLVSLIHNHLIGHHVLLRVLLVVWHHAHHLRVVKHLIRHLSLILLLHLLHTHAHVVHVSRHVSWHARHLTHCLLLLSCSVHIHYINY